MTYTRALASAVVATKVTITVVMKVQVGEEALVAVLDSREQSRAEEIARSRII